MSNSKYVDVEGISPHKWTRTHKIDTITIHCFVGQVTAKRAIKSFQGERVASCNYAVGYDGRVALIVPEEYRSGCSSNIPNDNRAITIEVACDSFLPYKVTDEAYNKLILLVSDICQRNGIKKLLWQNDKSLIGDITKQNMTVHQWFKNKDCPGPYLLERHGDIANKVNEILNESEDILNMTKDELKELIKEVIKEEVKSEKIYHYWKELPSWSKVPVYTCYKSGVFAGASAADLNLSQSKLETICMLYKSMSNDKLVKVSDEELKKVFG